MISQLIQYAYWVIVLLVVAWAAVSWLPQMGVRVSSYHPAILFLRRTVEPMMKPFQKITWQVLPPWKAGGLDLSPMVFYLALLLVKNVLQLAFRGH